MRKLIVIAIVLFLSACATTMMAHPTKTDLQPDLIACQLQAEQRSANYGAHGNFFLIKDWTQECLERRGWVKQ